MWKMWKIGGKRNSGLTEGNEANEDRRTEFGGVPRGRTAVIGFAVVYVSRPLYLSCEEVDFEVRAKLEVRARLQAVPVEKELRTVRFADSAGDRSRSKRAEWMVRICF
jgi:hypothetical protein